MPQKVLGIPIRNILFNRAIGMTLPPYYTDSSYAHEGAGKAARLVRGLSKPFNRAVWWGMEAVSRHVFKLEKDRKPVHRLPHDLFISGQVRNFKYSPFHTCEIISDGLQIMHMWLRLLVDAGRLFTHGRLSLTHTRHDLCRGFEGSP